MQQKLFVQIFDLVTENSFLAKMNKPIIMKNTKKNKKHGTNLFRENSEKVFVLCDMFYALKDICRKNSKNLFVKIIRSQRKFLHDNS